MTKREQDVAAIICLYTEDLLSIKHPTQSEREIIVQKVCSWVESHDGLIDRVCTDTEEK